MKKTTEVEMKVGVFVILGVILCASALMLVSGSKSIFERSLYYTTTFPQVEGIAIGSIVKIAGFRVGQVEEMTIREGGDVQVRMSIMKKYSGHVKQDSYAQLGTLGVLGDKYINISIGTPNAPIITPGGEIKAERAKEFKDYLSKGDQLIENLSRSAANLENILGALQRDGRADNIFKNFNAVSTSMQVATKDLPQSSKELQSSMQHLKSIMAKIDRGDGTIGALINDQSLYDDLKALLGGANRNKILKYFIKKSVEESRDARTQPSEK